MFGSLKTKSVDTMDSFLLVVEAKKKWPNNAIPQVLCEAGCLLKKGWLLERILMCLLFSPIGQTIVFLLLTLIVLCILLKKSPKVGTYNSNISLSEILR
jgi:hypothetical protein